MAITNKGKNILLFYGGVSSEHEISCLSAELVYTSMLRSRYQVLPIYISRDASWHLQKKVEPLKKNNIVNPCFISKGNLLCDSSGKEYAFDFAFPIIHGTTGEDGSIQGYFEFMNIPYAGVGVATSALCMDKRLTRMFFDQHDIPQVKYLAVSTIEYQSNRNQVLAEIKDKLHLPLFTKPCNMGSSVGVNKVSSFDTLEYAIENSFSFDNSILIEQGEDVREIEIAIMGNFPEYQLSTIGEIIPHSDFYSYQAKYLDENGADLIVNPNLGTGLEQQIRQTATDIFTKLEAKGFARIDFFINKKNNQLLVNELNTLPGFTSVSMFPKLFNEVGKIPEILVKEIIELGIDRYQSKQLLKVTSH